MNKKITFVSIIIIQLIFLGGMALFHTLEFSRATKILLETEPVDPFSVFRGRYINLNYKISTIPATLFKDCIPRSLESNDYVYVVLKKKEKFWEPIAAYKNRPENTNFTFLRGKVYYSYSHNIRIKYGIESFFLSEESADEIERERINAARQAGAENRNPLAVEVAVTKEGRGYPVKLFWRDKEYR
ncbi:MAG: hypothetical protein COZ37_05675 [bacterium (Candidatus Ratteibacteria) CG_4_10_14_3_um_filter_41_18]|uniref:GDYXXLXY protein n=3 Tax=Candidatus Ratteibacteria TaxID=2979319 RepID=A0A2M7E9D5_9BACT|nr:MAG: hypothetical protein AUJ76_01305 [Candidatus Omnitrophica bacterium CG1_02_41_171]PIV64329.1 MAG: hypothetical protein COS11_02760 [bacterium (Candidatus Ratteibacteria) CG01_land_8_20_14_3_00_40_19]PIW74005.1 MAG: hypothetical protein CO004_03025 [bacterium (Candidatus Ratteibacteria) CG_4_8_14_3_um_filter_41_36]PIX76863.1 MAG: hypothetical protein COZ37_05675 [bacterium (Candidatus Ratteibacteria) CG_4_10_14_3_um_filter_41_18]PJA62502.1 MAG: hypothetical protein CO162_00755 [bacterium